MQIIKVLVGNPELTIRQVRSSFSLNRTVSIDTMCRVFEIKPNFNGSFAAKIIGIEA